MSIVVSDYVKGRLQKIKDEKEHTSFDSVIRELLFVCEGKVDPVVLMQMEIKHKEWMTEKQLEHDITMEKMKEDIKAQKN